ncbi:hypothetical protein CH293_20270 [Rhodococcus sp. 14-2470-1b]|nr:hypothetical protein CH293_20270 [Rhodococcus sp. 14-2470-1b]
MLLQAKAVRNKDRVIAELVDAGLWTWLDDKHLQQDWTGQETAADRAVKLESNAKRQADYVSRDRRCAAGDHSMCSGTKRKCQTKNDAVSDSAHSTSTPPHFHTTPRSEGEGEKRSDGSATPPSTGSPAGASTRSGPSSGNGASNNGAPTKSAPTHDEEIEGFFDDELIAAFDKLAKITE